MQWSAHVGQEMWQTGFFPADGVTVNMFAVWAQSSALITSQINKKMGNLLVENWLHSVKNRVCFLESLGILPNIRQSFLLALLMWGGQEGNIWSRSALTSQFHEIHNFGFKFSIYSKNPRHKCPRLDTLLWYRCRYPKRAVVAVMQQKRD